MVKAMSGRVPSVAYIKDPITLAYGTSGVGLVVGSKGTVSLTILDNGVKTGLAFCMSNHMRIVSMYGPCDIFRVPITWSHSTHNHNIFFISFKSVIVNLPLSSPLTFTIPSFVSVNSPKSSTYAAMILIAIPCLLI